MKGRLLVGLACLAVIAGLVGILPTNSHPQTAYAQVGPTCGAGLWDTTYFNDTNLTLAAYVGCTASVQINQGLYWGTGGPVGGVGPNNFSGRFVTNITFLTAGTYRFTSTFQDGARLYINGQPTAINYWGIDLASPQTLSADYYVAVPNQTVTVMLEVAKYTGTGQINLNWALIGGGGGVPTPTTAPVGSPWSVEYFNNGTHTPPSIYGSPIPAGPLNINWGTSAPVGGINPDGWSSRFTCTVTFSTGGLVTFTAQADDSVTVWVDGQAVTASAPYYTGEVYTGTINLTAGTHTVVVEHVDIADAAFVNVSWSGGGGGGVAPTAGPSPTPVVVSPTGVTGRVTAQVGLNYRVAPSSGATKIGRFDYNVVLPILGRNFDSSWAYVEGLGTRGWVYATWLAFTGDFGAVPVLDANGNPLVPSNEIVMFARPVGNMRIRECPSFSCGRLGYVGWGRVVGVYGQSADRRWVKISYTDGTGQTVVGWTYKIWYRTTDNLDQNLPADLPFTE
ncbi:MAG: SH3 domain-containing protein [Anaerolineales bacterium]|nr:SH3 domain-containing protein [Anaerolineales bacterium]